MSEKEREHEVKDMLTRIRESLKFPKKASEPEKMEPLADDFDRELSERLEKHLDADQTSKSNEALQEGEEEPDFSVDELEIVTDGTLDPDSTEEDLSGDDTVAAAEEALFSNLDALMARMTPEQRAIFEAEMNGVQKEEAPADTEEVEALDEPEMAETVPVAETSETSEISEEIEDLSEVEDLSDPEDEVTPEDLEEIEQPQQLEDLPWKEDIVQESEPPIVSFGEDETEVPEEDHEGDIEDLAENAACEETSEAEAAIDEVVSEESSEAIPEGSSKIIPEESLEDIETYTPPVEDEDYDLSEAEAFRALEARMTPEQRAQFEEALEEAQEARRQEAALAAEQRRAAREAAKIAEDEAETPPEETAPEESVTEETASEDTMNTISQPVDEIVAEPVDGVADEAAREEMSAETHVVVAGEQDDESDPGEAPIFMAVDEDEEDGDMPAIKVGFDTPAFTLVKESEPESEPLPESDMEPELDEDAVLAALLMRLTPEQLARIRAAMLGEDDETAEAAPEGQETIDFTSFSGVDEPIAMEEIPEDEPEEPSAEEDVADEVSEDHAIASILDDPEKLKELMSRMTPEQAEAVKRMLYGEEEETSEEASVEEEPQTVPDHVEEETETYIFGEERSEEETAEEETFKEEAPVEEEYEEVVAEILAENEKDEPAPEDGDTWEEIPADEMDEVNDPTKQSSTAPEQYDSPIEDDGVYEISEDMSDEEISVMLELGYEKELTEQLGRERIAQIKMRAARDRHRDPEFTDAYAYEGEEYRRPEQTDRIRYRYGVERRRIWGRLIGTSVCALLLFLYECCGLFSHGFGDVFNAAHYPVITIMAGLQLLILAAAFSYKQLYRGIRSALMLEPDNHSMTAVIVAVVMFSDVLMAIVFKGSHLMMYNFPAALCLLCSVLCDFADVCREEAAFRVISSEANKYVAEAITLTSAHTDMPLATERDEKENPRSSKNAMYVRRVGFVKHYFRRTGKKTRHSQILNFVFLPLLAFSVVMGVISALIGDGIAPALNTFVVSVLLCMPLAYTVAHTLPLFYETRRLSRQGCTIVGEETVEESNQYSTVIFEDKELFPPMLISTKGLKLHENDLIYSVILKISLLFREIGGPINEVLDLDKEEVKRFIATGQAGALAEGRVELEHASKEGVTARLSDGSYVVAGSAAFLRAHDIAVQVSAKDQQLIDTGNMSILFLAFDGELSARFYVDYQPDPEFEAMAGMLHEDGFRVAVRTLDPNIHENMIARKCGADMPTVGTVRTKVKHLTEHPQSDARVDGGLVCSEDPRKMLLPLRAVRNLRRLSRFALRLYAIAMLINMAVVIVLTACSVAGFMSSLFVSLYMLVWLATSLVMTALFLNK